MSNTSNDDFKIIMIALAIMTIIIMMLIVYIN